MSSEGQRLQTEKQQNVWERLVEPQASVVGFEARRKARLLASLLLVVGALSSIGFAYTVVLGSGDLVVLLTQGGAAVIMLGLYALSRTARYRVVAWTVIGVLFAAPFGVVLLRENSSAGPLIEPFMWAMLPILLSNTLLTLRAEIAVAVLNVVGLLVLPLLPLGVDYSDVVLPLGYVAVLSGLTLTLGRNRDLLERDRQTELQTNNRELQAIRDSLEERVTERTVDLELRTRYLEATAAVAREAASLFGDPGTMLTRVVNLISERFGFYHAGLFLLDPAREWAELRAASSEGGQRMLARQHRLRVGAQGLVGAVAASGLAHRALNVGDEATFFDNPDLPETRSETVLPLRSRGQVIGVLDVQSKLTGAFSVQDESVLQSLADQVAVAIDNARLYRQAEESIEAERRVRGQIVGEAWRALSQEEGQLGYLGNSSGVRPAGEIWHPEMGQALATGQAAQSLEDGARVAIPIQIGDRVIAVVDGRKRGEQATWSEEETSALQALGDELSAAMERSRLYRETRRSAAREQALGEITANLARSLDIEGVLQTVVRELGQTLPVDEVSVWIAPRDLSSAEGSGEENQ